MNPERDIQLRELAGTSGAMGLGEDHFIFTVPELERFLALAREAPHGPPSRPPSNPPSRPPSSAPPLPY